jgi:hypothetical protein
MARCFWFLVWLVVRSYAEFRPQRTIYLDGRKYMTRYFLTSSPVGDETGTPGRYLQRLHMPDADRRLHNHPWESAETRVLRGGYLERREYDDGKALTFVRRTGDRASLPPGMFHRIFAVADNTWTLFHAGTKHGRSWGFR